MIKTILFFASDKSEVQLASEVMRERERESERDVHFTIRVTPIIPAFGNDNVVHICVSKDDPRERTPCPPKVECSRARDLTVHKREPRVI